MRVGTFDLESNGFLDVADRVWCAAIKDHSAGTVKTFSPSTISDLCSYLDTFDVLIGHNCVGFDFPLLKKVFGWEFKGKVVDTLLMSRTQNPDRLKPPMYQGRAPHSVEAWGHRLGGEQKVEHDEWDRYSPEMLERCVGDTTLQYDIYEALIKEGRGKRWAPAHKLNVQIFKHLGEQEEHGFTIDVPHLEACLSDLTRWIDRIFNVITPSLPYLVEVLETKNNGDVRYVKAPFKKDGGYSKAVEAYASKYSMDLHSIAGPFSRVLLRRVNLNSNKEVKDFLLSKGWIPDEWNLRNGVRTSAKFSKADSFTGIQGSLGRLVAKGIQCRQRRSILEGWQQALRPDNKLPTPVSGIATTGRLKHRLVVNIPSPHSGAFFARQMRECFIASPGMVMVGCDSKGNQMRQLAGRMDDPEFTEAVLHGNSVDGTDLHSLNQRKSGAATRSLAKNFFYGSVLFGAGDAKTAQLLETTKPKAKKLKEDYMASMPKLVALLDSLKAEWRLTAKKRYNNQWRRVEYHDGYIAGADGRPVKVVLEKDLLCYALQSDEAIQLGVAYVMIHKWADRDIGKGNWAMLYWGHDEFQMETHLDNAVELGEIARKAIKWAGEWLGMGCPHDGDVLIGKNWYECH
jgi:hypothetical protein